MKTNYALLFLPFFISCGAGPEVAATNETADTASTEIITYDQITGANWLLGTWEDRSENYVSTESWTQLDDSTFIGSMLTLAAGDTINNEQIRVEERNGQLLYIPTVADQNDGLPVQFTATSVSAGELVFENPGHDFPQKITYTLVNPDSIVAVISGIYESQESSQAFPMKKVR